MNNQPRCPYCQRYQQNEPAGFYGKIDPSDDMSGVEVFCDEDHYDKYQYFLNRKNKNLLAN